VVRDTEPAEVRFPLLPLAERSKAAPSLVVRDTPVELRWGYSSWLKPPCRRRGSSGAGWQKGPSICAGGLVSRLRQQRQKQPSSSCRLQLPVLYRNSSQQRLRSGVIISSRTHLGSLCLPHRAHHPGLFNRVCKHAAVAVAARPGVAAHDVRVLQAAGGR
jgi:hypothetical protein